MLPRTIDKLRANLPAERSAPIPFAAAALVNEMAKTTPMFEVLLQDDRRMFGPSGRMTNDR
jgi:hypothetical protein